MTGKQLKAETNTPAMERRILRAARGILRDKSWKVRGTLVADFEHGQWWVTDKRSGAQWSVVDAEGPGIYDGFDLEQVTSGEEVK